MSEQVPIGNARLTATIAAKGAEIQSLVPASGHDVMWSGGETWPWHAPNLFPIVGALADDTLLHDGKRYTMKQHGFLRHSICAVTRADATSCAFRLVDNDDTRAQYPFAFDLAIEYRVEDDRLECTYHLSNPGKTPLPASIGAHPGFRRPLGGGKREDDIILFTEAETAPIRRLGGRTLAPDPRPTPVKGRVMRLDDALFDDDAVIFDHINSRKVTYGAPGGPGIEIGFGDFPNFGIWSKPGATPFVCLEPWQGMASPAGFSGDFSEKPGTVTLAPGSARSWRYYIRPVDRMPGV
jgi:galactose mutarotase-like enzyme